MCASTPVTVAGDLDPTETAEPPMIAVHAYLDETVVSHSIALGAAGVRSPIAVNAPGFVAWARARRDEQESPFDVALVVEADPHDPAG